MVEIGEIKTVTKKEDQLLCTVSLATGEKTAVFYSLPGIETYPLKGDIVSIKKTKSEYIIESIFIPCTVSSGGTLIFSRNAGGITGKIALEPDGKVVINDYVEILQ